MPTEDTVVPVVETTTSEPAAPVEWSGDFDALTDDIPWWKGVPETARTHFTSLREKAQEAEGRASYLDKLFESDDAVTSVRAELATKEAELASLKEALSAAETKHGEVEARYKSAAEQLADIEEERAFDRLKTTYPDIFNDLHYKDAEKKEIDDSKGAWLKFAKLLQAGIPEEEAAIMARAFLPTGANPAAGAPVQPAPPPRTEREVEVPLAVRAATPGGSNPATTVRGDATESIEEAHARLARLAALEEGHG